MSTNASCQSTRYDTIIAGGGLAGIVTALELLPTGQRVLLSVWYGLS